MIVSVSVNGNEYTANLKEPISIGIPVARKSGVSSFGIANAKYVDYRDGGFIGNKNLGGPCNLETITFTPHGNSTHTECLGHIALEKFYVNVEIEDTFLSATLITLENTGDALDFTGFNWQELNNIQALIIRTKPNNEGRKELDYSGKPTSYISVADMQQIVQSGIEHLLIDLPSVDPEWDEGKLEAHHIFWDYPKNPRLNCSITEFVYVPDNQNDGKYLLKLNIAPFISDAAPSNPTLYKLI